MQTTKDSVEPRNATAADGRKRAGRSRRSLTRNRSAIKSDRYLPYILCSPTVVTLLLITVYPIFYSFYMSFADWRLGDRVINWVGFRNYEREFVNPDFWASLSRTIVFALGTATVAFILGVTIAMLFSREFRFSRVVRGLILMPMMVTPTVVGFMFLMIYNGDYGILNWILQALHITNRNYVWLGHPTRAFISAMVADVWTMTPFIALLTVAGLQSLPSEPYESARVDGASSFQMFVHITIPMLRNILLIAFTLRLIVALRTFDKIYVLTGGGPGGATEILSLRISQAALQFFQIGRASALNVVLVLMTMMFLGLLILLRKLVSADER